MMQRFNLSSSIRRVTTPLFLFAALASTSSLSAHAATIIADGGFESATGGVTVFAGSSIDGGSWNVTRGNVYVNSSDPYTFAGTNSVNLTGSNPNLPNTISQTLVTVAGQTYTVSFFADADATNIFSLLENGLAIAGTPTMIATNGFPGATSGSNSSLFTSYTGMFTANSTSTLLSINATASVPFNDMTGIGSVVVDNFNVSTASTPEPGSMVLVLTGIMGLGQAVRRRFLTNSR